MRPLSSRLLPLAFLALQSFLFTDGVEEARAQGAPSSLTVVVRAGSTLQPLPGAQVIVQGMGIGGVTDASGTLRLADLPVGSREVEVRFLGYAPARSVVVLQPEKASRLTFDLVMQPIQLAEVKVRTRRSILQTNGFFNRRDSSFGTFMTRQEIQAMRPRYMSDVLRRVAGVSLTNSAHGGAASARIRGTKVLGSCPIQYYLDGTMTAMFNIDEVRPEDVEGIEIYRGAATIPPSFNKGSAMCGVIVIWTRIQ